MRRLLLSLNLLLGIAFLLVIGFSLVACSGGAEAAMRPPIADPLPVDSGPRPATSK